MRPIEYKNILAPSIDYLEGCGSLMLDTRGMAKFLGIAPYQLAQIVCTDRIPLPSSIGSWQLPPMERT